MEILENRLNEFYKLLKKNKISKKEVDKIKKAWEFAKIKHGNQLRKSGEPYIIHPLEAAIFLCQWKMDANTIIAGLLHDVLEDTETTEEEINDRFGLDVLSMVIGVTKVSTVTNENRSKENKKKVYTNESLMKVLLSISTDIRIIIIKLADRLHNMNTICHLNIEKQKRIAKETFDVFANIAGRIGMYDLKTILLDLSFAVLYPNEYEKTKIESEKYIQKNQKKVDEFNQTIIKLLKNDSIDVELKTRTKGVYSTNKKLNVEKIRVKDVYDIFASRIIINGTQLDCYKILGIAHLNFTFLSKRFKDYISRPKLNLYQSLHTIIIYEGIYIELQIRNQEMDEISSFGLAAHWRYKERKTTSNEVINKIVNQVASITENDGYENINKISKNRFFEVFYRNNNKWYIVDENQTVLDVAFKANPEDFLKISSIMMDHKKTELYKNMKPGSVIEGNYSTKIKCTLDWLDWCAMDEAKDKINRYFLEIENENEKTINDFLKQVKDRIGNDCATEDEIRARIITIGFKSFSEFISFLENKKIDTLNPNVLNMCLDSKYKRKVLMGTNRIKDYFLESKKKSDFYFKDLSGVFYKKIIYPKCCSKVPGIECIGIIDRWELSVHNYNCKTYQKNKKEVVLHWDYDRIQNTDRLFNCQITMEVYKDISNKVINLIIDLGFKIIEIKTAKLTENRLKLDLTINVRNIDQAQIALDEIKIKYSALKIEIV
ncbi:MAG: RelA/SpoT family protein [Mycoplasmoidaceae bacterium]